MIRAIHRFFETDGSFRLRIAALIAVGVVILLLEACQPADSTLSGRSHTTVASSVTATDSADGPVRRSTAAAPRFPQFPTRQGRTSDITFDDLELQIPLKTLFQRSMLTDRAEKLDGTSVRIRGFIYAGGVFQQTGITSFPLVKNTQCKFGPQGLAYCVILVDLDPGVKADFTTRPVTVEGTLSVRPFNSSGFTWSVYHLQGTKVF